MPSLLKISIRFLLDEFDGRGAGGEPEWPPSPLRLFQALTNSAARLDLTTYGPALKHLEQLSPPLVVASSPAGVQSHRFGFETFVPNNVGDLVAKSWTGGRDNDIANYRAAKKIRPTRLPENAAVHYLWDIDGGVPRHLVDRIQQLARAISAFGWGVNMVVADAAAVESGTAPSANVGDMEKWLPSEHGSTSLRVPIKGTLDALEVRHQAFLSRLPVAPDGSQFFRPVPPLEHFRIIRYRRETDLIHPPFAIFALRELDDSKFATFDPQWRRLHLAGMLRNAASKSDFAAVLGWDETKIKAFVLGHDENGKPTTNAPRLVFIPLPSIEWRGEESGNTVGAIRRVLVTFYGHYEETEFQRIVRALEGRELFDEKKQVPVAFLRRQSENDQAISAYFAEKSEHTVWTTVTPVVLPGHDDPRQLRRRLSDTSAPLSADAKEQIVRKLDERTDRLLRKALLDAGIPSTLVADADLQWRGTGFLPGVDLASRYSVPDQCRRFRRLHVRITWRQRSPDGQLGHKIFGGPLCIGSGRYSGLGLFAAINKS